VKVREVVFRGLLEASCQAAEALEVVEEHLDQVPYLVGLPVEPGLLPANRVGMNDRLHPGVLHALADRVRVVARVADELFAARVVTDDRLGDCRLVLLPRCDFDVERAAFRVGEGVDLGGEPTSRTTQCIADDPPFPPAASWWARTTDASMRTASSSTRNCSALKIFAQ
jgi:hypothetical protein